MPKTILEEKVHSLFGAQGGAHTKVIASSVMPSTPRPRREIFNILLSRSPRNSYSSPQRRASTDPTATNNVAAHLHRLRVRSGPPAVESRA